MHIRQAERKESNAYREEEVSIPRNNRRREGFVDLGKTYRLRKLTQLQDKSEDRSFKSFHINRGLRPKGKAS